MKLKKGRIYLFEWVDTYNYLGWHYEDDIDGQVVKDIFQSTLGFYIKDVGEWHIVAMHHNPNTGFAAWGNIAYIPKKSVKRITSL